MHLHIKEVQRRISKRTRVRRTNRTRRKVNKSQNMRVQVPRHQKERRRRQSVYNVTRGSILRVL
jgi:hypothetical protein